MERDFCSADWFMPHKRGSLDPAYLEMSLFLRAQFDYIPNDAPRLTEEQSEAAVPSRLRDQTMLDDVQVLDVVPGEKDTSDGEGDEDDAEWVLQGLASHHGQGRGSFFSNTDKGSALFFYFRQRF